MQECGNMTAWYQNATQNGSKVLRWHYRFAASLVAQASVAIIMALARAAFWSLLGVSSHSNSHGRLRTASRRKGSAIRSSYHRHISRPWYVPDVSTCPGDGGWVQNAICVLDRSYIEDRQCMCHIQKHDRLGEMLPHTPPTNRGRPSASP